MAKTLKANLALWLMVGIGMVSVVLFVAEKLAENEAARQYVRFYEASSQALELKGLGWWQWNIDSEDIFWSNQIYVEYGLDPDHYGPVANYDFWLQAVHPDDRERADAESTVAMGNPEQGFLSRYRVVTPKGHQYWVTDSYGFSHDGSLMLGFVQRQTHDVFYEYLERVLSEGRKLPPFSDLRHIPEINARWGYLHEIEQ